jgi:hypothetical protein
VDAETLNGARRPALNRARKPLLGFKILVLACSLGCSTPVGVARVDTRRVYRTLTSNVT